MKRYQECLWDGEPINLFSTCDNSGSGSAVLHECSLFIVQSDNKSFSFQEYLACSQGVVNRWSSRKCRFHIIDLSAVWSHNIMVKGHCWIWHFLSAINTKLVDKPNCQDMWVRDSSVHKGLPGPDGYPSGPGALSWLSGDQLYSRLEDKMKLLELNDNLMKLV